MYAVLTPYGDVIDDNLSYADALKFKDCDNTLEVVDMSNASKLSVWYTELGGPYGYGHKEPSFITYGPLKTCISRLYKWMKEEARIWGPDWRDVYDYFRHCDLTINGEDKTKWMIKQAHSINNKMIFV